MPENYLLYYTNNSIDKNIILQILNSNENPKYITVENFIFKNKTYDKYGEKNIYNDDNDIGGAGERRVLDQIKIFGDEETSKYIYQQFS